MCPGPSLPRLQEFEKQYQPPVIHLGRVLSVGDGIARVYGLKSVQVRTIGSVPDPGMPSENAGNMIPAGQAADRSAEGMFWGN